MSIITCPHCGGKIEQQIKGVETISPMDAFNQAFGGSASKKEEPPTLNDEMKMILMMDIGDKIDWGGGMLERHSQEVWIYHHDAIDGGEQWFSEFVDLRSMAMKYPAVKEDFIDRMGVKFWGSDYNRRTPEAGRYNGFTGFTNQQVLNDTVDCTQVGYQGLAE